MTDTFRDALPLIQSVLDDISLPREQHDALSQAADIIAAIRPEVAAFAALMEAQLRANDHKPGWANDTVSALHARLIQEAMELRHACRQSFPAAEIGREAADVANFAMMIADVCRALTPPNHPGGQTDD